MDFQWEEATAKEHNPDGTEELKIDEQEHTEFHTQLNRIRTKRRSKR